MMSKKIYLVMVTSGSQGDVDMSHLPLGLIYVGSSLRKEGYDVQVRHIGPRDIPETVKEVAAEGPLWCGLSVLSGSTTYWAAVFSESLRASAPSVLISWGGHHATLQADECLSEGYVDFIVRGEGELTSVEASRALEDSGVEGLKGVEGVSYVHDGDIHHNADRPLVGELDELPFDVSLVDVEQYLHAAGGVRAMSFFSSRGCPFNCAFCSTSKYTGKSYRAHSPEYVAEKLLGWKESYGVDSVFFSDDNFYLHKDRAKSILSSLLAQGITTNTLDVRLDQLDESDILFFKEHDVSGVFFGWESGSDRLLKLIRKRLTVDGIMNKAELLAKHDISCWCSSIILLPTETFDETMMTIRLGTKLRKILRRSTVAHFRYMPLPKTDLTSLAIDGGFQYPSRQKEWRKIDPLETDYRVEWLPWYDDQKHGPFVRAAQEYSRSGIASYRAEGIRYAPFNLLAERVNGRLAKGQLPSWLNLRANDLLCQAYALYKGTPCSAATSKILD